MSDEQFERLVADGINAIPAEFTRLLNNVAIVIEDEPTPEQRKKSRPGEGQTLFGLYEGIPPVRRSAGYSMVLPDKITIFRRPIEQAAGSPADIKRLVCETVWHEIAHHFGLDEAEVRAAEARRRRAG